jgi:hypothetical protein
VIYFQVFNDAEEQNLESCLKKSSDRYYDLSAREVRKFEFEFEFECSIAANKKNPESWRDMKMTDAEWFAKFLKRHKSLSVHKAETRSAARASSLI